MITYTAPSGAKVEITISDYSTALDLFKAVLKAASEGGIASKLPKDFDPKDFGKKDLREIGGFFDAIVNVIRSKEVDDLLFKCFERCTYDDGKGEQKITRATFEPVEHRGDFLFVAFEVGRENIRPFLSQLSFALKGIFPGEKTNSRKSK
jgi:hypothetical protein